MEVLTKNIYNNYYNKKDLNLKTKDELINLYITDFNIKPESQKNLLTKIKTKEDIIKQILTQRDTQYIKLIKQKYGKHIDNYTNICNNFTKEILNDESKSVRDRIHAIHDFIRNKGLGYGMTGLKLFNLFYGLLQIEKSGLLQKWKFSVETLENTKTTNEELIEKLTFTKILEFVNSYHEPKDLDSNKCFEIHDLITNLCETLRKFSRGHDSKLKNLIYYDLSHIKANAIDIKTLLNLINDLDKLSKSSNIQLGGKIYEYFIGRDQSAISELGAYFTDRHLVNYIFQNILDTNNTIDIDNLPKVCDMFGGSGGFTINFIVYVNKILDSKKYSEDDIYKYWEGKNIKQINHYDVNQDVVNNAKLEAFCLTHQLIGKCNFGTRNSFTEDYLNTSKYDLIISNPPYGGDKTGETFKMKEYNTIIEYNKNLLYNNFDNDMTQDQRSKLLIQNTLLEAEIKFLKDEQKKKCINYASCSKFIRDYCDKIIDFENIYLNTIGKNSRKPDDSFNDKESCSLVLLMALCAPGGRVLGVLKEGVFFDSKYTHIRRYLLKHFIVRRIDSNPSDAFENTTTKTSNILFELPKEEESVPDDYNVEFYDVEVVKNTKDEFNTRDNFTLLNSSSNGTIKSVESCNKKIVSVKEILANPSCSLNSKQYNNKPLVAGKGFKMVKLGDVCEIQNGYAFKTSEFTKTGYKVVKIKDINNLEINTKQINTFVKYNDKYKNFLLKDNDIILSLTGKNGDICNIGLFNNLNKEQILLNQRLCYLRNYKYNINYLISILKYISIPNLNINTTYGTIQGNIKVDDIKSLELPIPETEEQLQYWTNYISEPYEKLLESKNKLQSLEEKVKLDIQNILETEETEEVMLGELCELKASLGGTSLTQYYDNKSKYGFITGKNLNGSKDFIYINFEGYNKCKNFTVKTGDILIQEVYSETSNCILVPNKWNSYVFKGSFRLNNFKINNKFLYYYLNSDLFKNKAIEQTTGSIFKHLSINILKPFKIQIPKDRSILDTLNPTFEEIDTLNEDIPKNEELYKARLEELRKAAILE